jgi:3-hydroxyacyl-CoA dehydrogenase / enoyl-CoA hydratase / 3-hydroxybutyryl-CoA epimerase
VSHSNKINFMVATDGIAVLTIQPMVDAAFCEEFSRVVQQLAADPAVNGLLLLSADPRVFADGLPLPSLLEEPSTTQQAYASSQLISGALRRLEACGKPVACAIEGRATSEGFELALACHYRVMTRRAGVTLSMPNLRFGVTPAGGATQRLPRLAGIPAALKILLDGESLTADRAAGLNLINQVVDSDAAAAAREWLLTTPSPKAPWDIKGFKVPGGVGCLAPHATESFQAGTSRQARATSRNDPAPLALLAAVFEGTQLPIEAALRVESKYRAAVLSEPVATNRIRTGVVYRKAAESLESRPPGYPTRRVSRLGIIGAGLMGSGIARVAAARSIPVVLLDATEEKARAHIEPHAHIQATADFTALEGCDLVIEAVFEQRSVKEEVIGKIAAIVGSQTVIATNTSTLSVGSLAGAAGDAARFIGLHFFSPVEKMPLVEVITARHTADETLARALDFVAQLGKTPIVVRDSPGFYTSRVFGTYVDEGMALLAQGVAPALIENAARLAGMPIGPLAVCDEVSIQLQLAVHQQAVADGVAPRFQRLTAIEVVRKMVEQLNRPGRRGGGGFYDYLPGTPKRLWQGLRDHFPVAASQPPVDQVKRRLLHIQALESQRCLEEKVIGAPRDGDLAAVLGIGFPAWTGGPFSWMNGIGMDRFYTECAELARTAGARFRVG